MPSSVYHSGVAVTLDVRRAKRHDPEAAADAWRRTVAFFERCLRSAA
jgi:dienelactone hydrolase